MLYTCAQFFQILRLLACLWILIGYDCIRQSPHTFGNIFTWGISEGENSFMVWTMAEIHFVAIQTTVSLNANLRDSISFLPWLSSSRFCTGEHRNLKRDLLSTMWPPSLFYCDDAPRTLGRICGPYIKRVYLMVSLFRSDRRDAGSTSSRVHFY